MIRVGNNHHKTHRVFDGAVVDEAFRIVLMHDLVYYLYNVMINVGSIGGTTVMGLALMVVISLSAVGGCMVSVGIKHFPLY
ncbi:MAG: hypothetical protein ABSF82_02080 [Candidatus Bathyarchaeia archaeon]